MKTLILTAAIALGSTLPVLAESAAETFGQENIGNNIPSAQTMTIAMEVLSGDGVDDLITHAPDVVSKSVVNNIIAEFATYD